MVSREVLGQERNTAGCGGGRAYGGEGSWGLLFGLLAFENSLAQPLAWAPTLPGAPSWSQGLCLEPASLVLGWDQGHLTAGPGSPGRFLRANRACWMSQTSLPTYGPSSLSVHRQDKSLNPLEAYSLCSL